jgi:hypothetical protein
MTAPEDFLTQFDLQDIPKEKASVLAKARAAALAAQQRHALLGMLGTVPELQKAGAAEYGQAQKEREGVQETAANVFKTALGEKEAAARLKELELQGRYQLGMLGLQGRQAGETERSHRAEEGIREVMTRPTVPGKVLEDLSGAEKQMAQLDALKQAVPALGWVVDLAKKPIQAGHEATKKTVSGYRAMGAQGLPPEMAAPVPAAAVPTAVAPGPQAAAALAPTHFRYNKDRSMRIPTDAAGNALGPPEPNR